MSSTSLVKILKERVLGVWDSLGMDRQTLLLMLKGSIPTAISLALYRSTAASETYTSLGFLAAIIAVVTVNLLPRAKLIQMTFGICAFTAIAIPLAMLATWSGLQARFHTDPDGLDAYNSSQSAITGVWLFFHIWLSNSIQARYPHLLIPTILYNIFMIVQLTSCSRFTTWAECWNLIYLTIRCYYTGIAIGFFSGILIYPISCRTEIFEIQKKYIRSAQGVMQQSLSYLTKIVHEPAYLAHHGCQGEQDPNARQGPLAGESSALQQQMSDLKALYVKMHAELIMAKREIAWGKLSAKDITIVSDLCRRILMPIGGMSHLPDLLKATQGDGPMSNPNPATDDRSMEARNSVKPPSQPVEAGNDIWRSAVVALIEPASTLIEALKDGMQHAGLQLEVIHKTKAANRGSKAQHQHDTESTGDTIFPGDPKFSSYLESKLDEFWNTRLMSLAKWTKDNDRGGQEKAGKLDEGIDNITIEQDGAHDKPLHLILYIHQMLYSTGVAVHELCQFSDQIISEGVMSHNRLVTPSLRAVGNWLTSIFDTSDAAIADEDRPSSNKEEILVFGRPKGSTHSIEHLPPHNAFERFGVAIRTFQDFLKGPEFSFGFRSACATLSCAILAYLRPTQDIFTHYRLIWSVIIAAIGANMSAGQSGVSYVLRILGSLAALIICYLVWYIPNGNTAGVIVLMWFASFLQMYFLLKWPRYLIGWLVILITEVLSIGYLTQVNKIGVEAATAGGVIYYKPYEVCAVRVACVLWGTVASMFFTYLPYPITARGLLRKELAKSIHLVANYNTIVHHSLKVRLRGKEGDAYNKQSRGYAMSRTRKAIFNKTIALSASVKHSLYLQKYEPTIGGKFPVSIYSEILVQLTTLLDYIALISYSTQAWSTHGPHTRYYRHSTHARQWMRNLAKLIEPANESAEKITSTLYQLSNAVSTGRQLPVATEAIRPYQLWQTLQQFDPEILQGTHVQDLGYSTYAVVEVLSGVIAAKVNEMSKSIENLVGLTSFDSIIDDTDDELE